MKIFGIILVLGGASIYYGEFLPWLWHVDDGPGFSDSHRAATHFGVSALALGAPMIVYLGYKLCKLFDE